MDVKSRAMRTAQIFDLLAKVVLGLGVVAALILLGITVFGFVAGEGVWALLPLLGLLVVAAGTALAWAGVTLATVVAGYVAERS